MQKIIYVFVFLFSLFVWGNEPGDLRDWYKELGVTRTASPGEIRQAYEQKKLEFDQTDDPQEKKSFMELQDAVYNFLLIPSVRKKYDEFLTEEEAKKADRSAKQEKKKADPLSNAKGGTLLHKLLPKREHLGLFLAVANSNLEYPHPKNRPPSPFRRYGKDIIDGQKALKDFMKNGSETDIDKDKLLSLRFALFFDTLFLKNILQKNKVNINAQNSAGETALILSIKWFYPTFFYLLLKSGADVNLSDNQNNTPAHWLVGRKNKHYSLYDGSYTGAFGPLKGLNIQSRSLGLGVNNFENRIIKWFRPLLENKDLDLSIRNDQGMTALELAVQNGYLKTAKLMIKKQGINYLKSKEEIQRIIDKAIEYKWPDSFIGPFLEKWHDKYGLGLPLPKRPKTCREVFSFR